MYSLGLSSATSVAGKRKADFELHKAASQFLDSCKAGL